MSEITKAKNKRYYKSKKGKSQLSHFNLDVNLKGFLCSCNNREKDCIREAYNILNKYYDELYVDKSTDSDIKNLEEDSDDIAASLSKEIDDIRKKKQRFQVVESGAKNLIFIRSTVENPTKLVEKIVSDIHLNKSNQSKFLIRLVPIETTCKAYLKDIEKAFEPLVEKYFKEAGKTFSIVFNHRNNNSVSRDEVIKTLADMVAKARTDHKVNLKEAEVSIIVEVIRGFALIGVVPNFLKYKKYNLLCQEEIQSKKEEDNKD